MSGTAFSKKTPHLLGTPVSQANYQQKQWDEGAFLVHDQSALDRHISLGLQAWKREDLADTAKCLLAAEARREPNTGCMLDRIGQSTDSYFLFEKLPEASGEIDSADVDACLVFSGPAKHADPAVAEVFQNCSADYANQDGCRVPHTVWSANSRNKVPVASLHSTRDQSPESRARSAQALMDEAHETAMRALEGVREFDDPDLELFLFSGEGDSLHQIFDCIMQGPYARVDLWARGPEGVLLPGPSWARDADGAGRSRRLDLPCIGGKLEGDSRPPFTCGGHTRRAIIKYFVRRYINARGGGKGNTALAVRMVREKVAALLHAWGDKSRYACLCEDGTTHDLACCKVVVADSLDKCPSPSNPAGEAGLQASFLATAEAQGETLAGAVGGKVVCTGHFLPQLLHVQFDQISGEKVVEEIIRQIPAYLQGIFTDDLAEAFKMYNSPEEVASWDWSSSASTQAAEEAAGQGLYTSYRPIMNYTAQEAGHPFRFGRSLWSMCTGLVSQVMFTMPLAPTLVQEAEQGEGQWMWTAAGAFASSGGGPGPPFDPIVEHDKGAQEGLSALEAHVRDLLKPSFLRTSTFWHYVMRHVPSDSLVCAKNVASGPGGGTIRYVNADPVFPLLNASRIPPIKLKGYAHGALGEAGASCFCGWAPSKVAGQCTVPSEVCDALPEALRLALVQADDTCAYQHGSQLAEGTLLPEILRLWATGGGEQGWPCPSMELSDGWGLMSNLQANNWILWDGKSSSTLNIRVASLAHSGRAGVMLGNIDTLEAQAAREGLWPSNREHPLLAAEVPGAAESDRRAEAASLRVCASHILSTFDPASLVRDVVDDLFPAAQAVHESAPVSACLRYVIEYARLRFVELLAARYREFAQTAEQETLPQRIQIELEGQEATASSWRARCEGQLDLLGVCSSNGVFEMFPDPEPDWGEACPFVLSEPYTVRKTERRHYVTPGCLVFIQDPGSPGAFYDPCRMPRQPCGGTSASGEKQSVTLQEILEQVQTWSPPPSLPSSPPCVFC